MAEAVRLALPVYVQTSLYDMRHHLGYCFVRETPIAEVGRALELHHENSFVLFRRGGLNLIAYTHTESDVDRAVSVAREALRGLRRRLDDGDLAAAVAAGTPTTGIRSF